MFFTVSKNDFSKNHPYLNTHQFYDWNAYLDTNWKQVNIEDKTILYKGYTIKQTILEKIFNKDWIQEPGHYLILIFGDNHFEYHHDDTKSFPIWYQDDCLSNYAPIGEKIWWTGHLKWDREKFTWNYTREYPKFQDVEYDFDQCVDILYDHMLLWSNVLKDTDLPILSPETGGIDAAVCRAVADSQGIKYESVDSGFNIKAIDPSVTNNIAEHGKTVREYRNFSQIYFTDEPHIQCTGWWGDEAVLRHPIYTNHMLQPHGTTLEEVFDNVDTNCYMKPYYKVGYKDYIKNMPKQHLPTRKDAFEHVIEIILNDFQAWHNNNITLWTPFRDITLITKLLHADKDTIIRQQVNADLSRAVAKRFTGEKCIIDTWKNLNERMSNVIAHEKLNHNLPAESTLVEKIIYYHPTKSYNSLENYFGWRNLRLIYEYMDEFCPDYVPQLL
ncbi:MAG: hypothetical protein CMI58_03750 [Parcubacteria group bacterium]|jgi:hypothetical protein|nr:hypothetical protein [Parcubacteria group bacterium]|tara:strand:+ start:836 stop:2161 length:1326 start_codon:yes stop_codon:yes gene_type:complete